MTANGQRPEQAVLTKDSDPSKTAETRAVIEGMVDGLNDHRINDIGDFFAEDFRWMGNQGCGTKVGLREFQDNWQRPFQAAFGDKVCVDEARLFMGEWAAAFGRQEAVHHGEFMGIAPTGNIDPQRRYPSMFEPIHGSAFDIMGKGLANPVGTFWSCVMLLEHLGEPEAANQLMLAIERVTADPSLHPQDLGGKASTAAVTSAVCDFLAVSSSTGDVSNVLTQEP